MKISVIIPVYNVAKYIERCLLSVLNQTWQDLEVILVDDCTPDNSMEIVRQISAIHPRGEIVKVLKHETNRGQSAARNTAIAAAGGDFLYFLDSDDYLPLDSLSVLAKPTLEGIYDFVLGNYAIIGRRGADSFFKMKTGALFTNKDILATYERDLWPRTVWNMLIRRSFLFSESLYFEEGLIHEDDLWTFQLACKAHSAYFVNKVTYYYYIHFHSTTGNPSIWNLECRVRIIGLMYDFIQGSDTFRNNRLVYLIFEKAKAKYFDRILYFTKDECFIRSSYIEFRDLVYLPYFKALLSFYPSMWMCIRNVHYLLPLSLGFPYFKYFIKLEYYLLMLQIRIKRRFHKSA